LILGGHTHTFLPAPDIQKNADGNDVLVNQVGWAGIQLGRIDYFFQPLKDKASRPSASLITIGDKHS
jgi:5'-nucleotidase